MPAKNPAERSKRKRASEGEAPQKRRRSSSPEDEDEDPNAKILLLEQGILESKKNYNDITVLLGKMAEFEDENPEAMLAAVALCRVFARLLAQGTLTSKKGLSSKETVVVKWLQEQYARFKEMLLAFLADEELGMTALTLCMRMLKAEGETRYTRETEEYHFSSDFLESILSTLLRGDEDDVRKAYLEDYVEQYDDIRFYTFRCIKAVLESSSYDRSELFAPTLTLLSALDGVPESADELEDFYIPQPKKKTHSLRSVTQHKRAGQEAWLALMGILETNDQRKQVLSHISTVIAPWFNKPELLADFLTNCYDMGGSMSLLALSGVFYLIQERNLDYPSFYHKLYSLLDRNILHSKHRSRFFRLLDTFLGSTHLPAALVASFVKRLSRLALNAPPSAIVFVVPWIYNQLRRHPSCTFMLHKVSNDPEIKKQIQEQGMEDPFVVNETDPMQTEALQSCLWELVQLQSHYHPNVATIAKIMSEQFTKDTYNIEDFLDHSYASLLEAEMAKNVKKAPVVEFHIPKRIFLPQDEPAQNPDSLLVKLWDFGGVAA